MVWMVPVRASSEASVRMPRPVFQPPVWVVLALPDEPELTLAGIANLGDVCLIWVSAGGGEEPLRCYPLELQVTGENRYAFTAVLEAEMPLQDIYVCHREGLGDFVLVNDPDIAEVVVTTEDGEESSEQAPLGLLAAFMLLDVYYDYRCVDKNGNDMAGLVKKEGGPAIFCL